ncbi:putative polysaccharide biosynthesis protein [Pseudogracilibacillus sp. ICA-222130]|uniref:putative polysaccharide biosynthesis protein n=1 Tax=Pseudogracilibacillus sp. ICA-222130 TaxID=3134655 RepID=UPI0030BCA2E9
MKQTDTNQVVQGALLLTIAGLFGKVLSAIYRVPLQNLTGDIGFYVYQQIYPLIGMVMMLSLYGFPAAVSTLTAKQRANNIPMTYKHFYLPIFVVLLFMNGILFGVTICFAPYIASWIGDVQLERTFFFAAFLFLLVPFVALFRGVSQGYERMQPTAYSQIVEQFTRVTIIIVAAYFVYTGTLQLYDIGIFAVLATMMGMFFGLLTLRISFRLEVDHLDIQPRHIPWKDYFSTIFMLGFIAALNHMILLLLQFVDVFTLIPGLLQHNLSLEEAMQQKGVFDRGQPLIQFGIVFGSSFALALIPSVITKDVKENTAHLVYVREAVLFSMYIAVGATVGLILLMKEVNIVLFTNELGTNSLRVLSLSILMAAMTITMIAILQTTGKTNVTAVYILVTVILKTGLNILLIPRFGIMGSALATSSSLLFLCIIVARLLRKLLPNLRMMHHVKWKGLLIATVTMTMVVGLLKGIAFFLPFTRFTLAVYVLGTVVIGALTYMICLIRHHVLSKHQYEALPFSRLFLRLEKIVRKKDEEIGRK